MINEAFLLRAAAAVAAVAVVAGPYLVAIAKRGVPPQNAAVNPLADAHTILEIARRLQAAGRQKGVSLCQQLIDEMLKPSEPSSP